MGKLVSSSGELYHQAVTSPGPSSDKAKVNNLKLDANVLPYEAHLTRGIQSKMQGELLLSIVTHCLLKDLPE